MPYGLSYNNRVRLSEL